MPRRTLRDPAEAVGRSHRRKGMETKSGGTHISLDASALVVRRKRRAKCARDASEPLLHKGRTQSLSSARPCPGLFHRRSFPVPSSHYCGWQRRRCLPHSHIETLQKQIMRPSLIVTTSPHEPSTIQQGQVTTTVKQRENSSWPRRMAVLVTVATAVLLCVAAITSITTASTSHTQLASRRTIRREADEEDSERRRLTVFGADDRRAVSDASLYPYSAVGLLKWNADHLCTASLIGSKYAVTAAECVLTSDGKRRSSTLAKPEFTVGGSISSSSATTAHVVKIHRQSQFWKNWTQDTYVIVELDMPLGDTLGTFLLPTAKDLNQTVGKTPVQMVGFDADAAVTSTAALKFSKCTCYFPASFNGPQYMLHHDCDTSSVGSPGSALLVRYTSMETYIIGIHTNAVGDGVASSEVDKTLDGYSDSVANRGVLGPFIQQHLASIMADDKQESSSSSSEESIGSSSGSLNTTATQPPTTAPPTSAPAPTRDNANSAGSSDSLTPSSDSSSTSTHISSKMAYTCMGLVAAAWISVIFIAARHVSKKKAQPNELEAQVIGD